MSVFSFGWISPVVAFSRRLIRLRAILNTLGKTPEKLPEWMPSKLAVTLRLATKWPLREVESHILS
jgi:hypothetical protein